MKYRRGDPKQAALYALRVLRNHGHVALFAGGCVRDMLLSCEPKDYDVVTDAPPARVLELFPRARKVGAQFGVILIRKYGHDVEIATFRSDGPYTDGRHPDRVVYGNDVDDARRRDFTINGLFHDPIDDRVIDHIDGRRDIEAKLIRAIGDPGERFAEDHLRMLRAVRFAARFGFEIEQETLAAIRRLAGRLEAISAERVRAELEAILTSPTRATGWAYLRRTGLRSHVVSGWENCEDEDAETQRRLAALGPDSVDAPLAWACVWCRYPAARVRQVCRALRLSNDATRSVVYLVAGLSTLQSEAPLELADLKTLMAQPDWPGLLALRRADLLAREEDTASFDSLSARAAGVRPEEVAPPPLLTGDDLLKLGIPPGPKIGDVLAALYRAQRNENIADREEALALARRLMGG